jgi:glycerol-3-phosphate dehydrogenase subunit B
MKDFSPHMAASGLRQWPQFAGKRLDHEHIPSPFGDKGSIRDATALDLASFLDSSEGFDWLSLSLAGIRSEAACILLPSILGTRPGGAVHARLEEATRRKIVEMFCPPPSVTGLRMHRALMRELRPRNVHFVENATVVRAVTENGRCRALVTALPDREREYRAASFVIATGGLFSEGIITRPGEAVEAIFKLPVPVPPVQDDWSRPEFFWHGGHPFARLGVAVNGRLNPLGSNRAGLWDNVYFVGRSLGGYDFASEKSGSGVALATGHFAGTLV